jgi:hypothetical protein
MPLRVSALLLVLGSSGAACAAPIDWSWLKRMVADRIQISGTRIIGFHSYSVTGDREAFNTLNNYGEGLKRFTDSGAIDFSGRNVGGVANFQGRIDTSRFQDPQSQRFSIDYDRKGLKVNLGDIQGSMLNTNRFASFSKSLSGGQVQLKHGRWTAKILHSEAKGDSRTISIQGNNSAGPYYLNVGQIVRGSEEVRVDDVVQKLGEDYVVNYELGTITFVGRIIAPTNTIVVSFEAFGFNADRGVVQGGSTTYDLGKLGRVGLTAMRQVTGTGNALSSRVELFQGAGPPSTPYFLQFEPLLTRPITVKLDGVPQVEGVHYRFDEDNPTIFFFLNFVSLNSTIEVIYTPKPTSTVSGDREVVGLDYRYPLGENGHITYAQATGKLKNAATPLKGTARGIDAAYELGPYRFRAGWRDVPDGYVSVETRGFNRNEKAYDLGVEYERKGVLMSATHYDSDISVRRTDSGGNLFFSRNNNKTTRLSYEDTRRVGEPWRLELQRSDSQTLSGRTKLDTATASTSRTFGNLLTRLALESQQGSGPITTGSTTSIENIALQTIRLETSYTSGEEWAFTGRASASRIRAGDENGTGTDYALTTTYQPNRRVTANLSFTGSNSGQLALLNGFSTGYGLGYGGNGFSSGVGNSFLLSGATDFQLLRGSITSELSDRVSVIASAYEGRYAGNFSSNSKTKGLDLALDLNLKSNVSAFVNLNRSETSFIGSSQRSEATTISAGILGRPTSRWFYDLRASYLLTDGSSDLNQNDFGFEILTGYTLAPRHRVNLLYRTNHTTGFLPQDDTEFELSYGYQLWQNLNIVASYRFREVANLDGNPSGAYRAKGLNLEFRFGF